MKEKMHRRLLVSFCLFVLLWGFSLRAYSSVTIQKISVYAGATTERVILETDSILALSKTFYATTSPPTIFVEWEGVNTAAIPEIAPRQSSFVQDSQVEKIGEDRLRLSLRLQEQVPYSISSSQEKTIVELNKILQSNDEIYDEDIDQLFVRETNGKTFLKSIGIQDTEYGFDVVAQTTGEPETNIFTLDKPLRLVVDLFDTINTSTPAVHKVNRLDVKRVRAVQFRATDHMITRLVFDLKSPSFYTLTTEDKNLVISFYQNGSVNSSPQVSTPVEVPLESGRAFDVAELVFPAVKEIPEEKTPPLNPPAVLQPQKQEPLPKTEMNSETLPEDKMEKNGDERRREALAFLFEEKEKRDSSLKVQNIATEKPVLKGEENPGEARVNSTILNQPENKYTGEILTLKFKDADLRDVVLFLGEFAGLNVIFDPEVSGIVTCDLVDVPWDQALDIILKTNKMGKTLDGNVLRIAPLEVLAKEEEQQSKLRESRELASPVLVKIISLSYSEAEKIKEVLTPKLSSRGEIIVDQRTNTLVISEVEEKIALLEKLITVLDTATPQVSIEARIVEASSQFSRDLGIQWGFKGTAETNHNFPNNILVDGTMITGSGGGPLGGYAINLPAPSINSAIGISLGNILDTFRLDVALTALESSGEGRIISCPKITTQNNMEAEIIQGRQIPVQTVANFSVTTTFRNAALELKAKPQITADGTIIMTLEISNNSPDWANAVDKIPAINTQSAKTTVMVRDGGTTVIGGIYRTEDSVSREGVPFLSKIPLIGNLFRSSSRTKENRELLIFITPRIVR